jgi:hypothetical protein
MLMPEAAVDEYGFTPTRKCEVRFTRQITPVETEPVTHGMCGSADTQLRLHVFVANSPHISTTLFF